MPSTNYTSMRLPGTSSLWMFLRPIDLPQASVYIFTPRLLEVPLLTSYTDYSAAGIATVLAGSIEGWNKSLLTRASDFASKNTQATMLVFSSHKVLSEVLDNPGAQGFAENAMDGVGRGIWRDSLHLTPAVHEILASRMSSALDFDYARRS